MRYRIPPPAYAFACTLLALAGCKRGSEALSDSERAAIASAVEQSWANMMAGASALDADRIRAGYAARPVVTINGMVIEDFDRDQFVETRRWLGTLRHFEARYDNVHLEVLGPTSAVATMNHHLKWTDTIGLTGEWNSAWTAVFRHIGDRWQIVQSHESVAPTDR